MKISISLLILLSFVTLAHPQIIRDIKSTGIISQEPAQFQKLVRNIKPIEIITQELSQIQMVGEKRATIDQNIQMISDTMQKQASNAAIAGMEIAFPPKFNNYDLATTIFNSQKYFGDLCNRCKKLQYLAFRQGSRYLTAKSSWLQFQTSSSPSNSQLFVAEQQIDGSWAFKSLTEGKYISASYDGSSIKYQSFVGPWERWYMERHGSHVHVQSAQYQFNYWIISPNVLKQLNGGASAITVQHLPKINWLWNW